MFTPLSAVLAALLSPALEAPAPDKATRIGCGTSISAALGRFASVQLAANCHYEQDVFIEADRPLRLRGATGAVINGRISVSGSAPVTLESVEVHAPSVALLVNGRGDVTLQGARLTGQTALHMTGKGHLAIHDSVLLGDDPAVWVERAAGLAISDSLISGRRVSLVARGIGGPVNVHRSHLRAEAAGDATAGTYIESQGAIAIMSSRLEYVARPGVERPAVIQLDGHSQVDETTIVGTAVGVRVRGEAQMGCNQFHGTARQADGRATRRCSRDLAPDRLDWRARVGRAVAEAPLPR